MFPFCPDKENPCSAHRMSIRRIQGTQETEAMTKLKLLHLKNEMWVANFSANFIAVFGVNALMFSAEGLVDLKIWTYTIPYWIDALFTPFAFAFVGGMTLLYEKPIRRYLNAVFRDEPIPADLQSKARRRLLNEPFVLIALDFSMWLLSSIVYPIIHWIYGSGKLLPLSALYHNLATGIITITIAFFLLEHISQKKLAPHFFPNGGLHTIPRTLRIRIRTRLVALLFAGNLIPLISIILIIENVTGG